MLFQMACVSAWSDESAQVPDMLALLQSTRANKALEAVSGALVYARGSFFHIAEGGKDALDGLFEIIQGDSRHRCTTRLSIDPVEHRTFHDWELIVEDSVSQAKGKCTFDCEHCPLSSLCELSSFRARLDSGDATLPSQARVMFDWFLRIHLRDEPLTSGRTDRAATTMLR